MSQLIEAGPFRDTEHHTQDHFQGQLLHPHVRGEHPIRRPPPHLGLGQFSDHVAISPQGRPVERGHEQFAGAQVHGLVGEQHRMLPHDGFEDDVSLTRMEHRCGACEHGADVFHIGEEDDRPFRVDPQPHDIAVASP